MRISFRSMAAVVCGGLVASLVVAPNAAAFKTGTYSGITSQGEAIGFKATKKKVKKLGYRVSVGCEDGTAMEFEVPFDGKTPISEKGRFALTLTEATPVDVTLEISGKVKRKKAHGTITATATNQDGTDCYTAVDWSAGRQKPAGEHLPPPAARTG
jgi:hypothetical protein